MALSPEDVKNRQFGTTRSFGSGYLESEVDDFLDEVYEEFTRLTRENEQLRSQLAAAQGGQGVPQQAGPQGRPPASPPAPVSAPAPAPAETATTPPAQAAAGILALAQRTADEHMSEARGEAERIVGEARHRAEEMARELADQRETTIGTLEEERSSLERTIEDLRAFEREYRSRLKAYLEAQLGELSGRRAEEPGPAPGLATP